MADARCSCGALALTLRGLPKFVLACHCRECQRRTGAPFGVGAFYPAEAVAISGTAKEFTRVADSGGKVHTYFCPNCGTTVYWTAERLPAMVGVAVGALEDAENRSAPAISIYEQSRHGWVHIAGDVQHLHRGTGAKLGPTASPDALPG